MDKKIINLIALCLIGGLIFILGNIKQAQAIDFRKVEVKTFDFYSLKPTKNFLAYPETIKTSASISACDLNGNRKTEIIIGAGKGLPPEVRIFNEQGKLKGVFLAYHPGYKGGVNVACGDLNKDGLSEIVTAPASNYVSLIRTFDLRGNPIFTPGFYAYGEEFKGGVNIAVGDVNGDGRKEIITGAGPGGGPHVRVFNRYGEFQGIDFWPFNSEFRGGVSVAAADVNNDGKDEIIMGAFKYGAARIKVYEYHPQRYILSEFLAFPESIFQGGVNVALGDINGDGKVEIVAAANQGGAPHIRIFKLDGTPFYENFFAYENEFRGGVNITVARFSDSSYDFILTAPAYREPQGRTDFYKYIEVIIAEQKLYAYENGHLIKTSLVSTGLSNFPTPKGIFKIYSKILKGRMTGFYGAGNPYNYDLDNVPHILAFWGDYTLHGAYWHNDFGRPRSHGCVNLPLDFAAWLYNWASIGTPVIIR